MIVSDIQQELTEMASKIGGQAGKKILTQNDLSQHDAEIWAKELFNRLNERIRRVYDPRENP